MVQETDGFVRWLCPKERDSHERYEDRQRWERWSIRAEEDVVMNRIERLSLEVVTDVKRGRGGPVRDRGQGVVGRQRGEGRLVGRVFQLAASEQGLLRGRRSLGNS